MNDLNLALNDLLVQDFPELSVSSRMKIGAFYEVLRKENEVQNLTRLITPTDFCEGHLKDVLECLKTGWLSYPAMDLGSGGGIPGLLAAAIDPQPWVLCDSEKRKADFLTKAVEVLEMKDRVTVSRSRGEDFLKNHSVSTIIARAVGPIERIYGWIRGCSTWNNLILFKGPSWDEEWSSFQASKQGHELAIVQSHAYEVGSPAKKRLLVQIRRVPRGTKPKQPLL